ESCARFRRGVGKSIEGHERLASRMDRAPDPVDRKAGNSGSKPAAALGYVRRGLIRPLRTAESVIFGIAVNVGHTAVTVTWRIGTIVISEGGAVGPKREAVGIRPECAGENVSQKKRPEHRSDPASPTTPTATPATPAGPAAVGKAIPFMPVAERIVVDAAAMIKLVPACKLLASSGPSL